MVDDDDRSNRDNKRRRCSRSAARTNERYEREASAKARTGSDLKREAKWRIVERRKEKKKGRRSERGEKNGRG